MARGDDGSGKYDGGFKLFGVNINLRDGLYKKSSSSESMKKKKSYEAESITKKRSHEGDDDCMRKSKSMGNLHEMYNREEHQSGPSGFGGGDDGSGGVGGGDVFGGVGDVSGVVGGDYVSGGGDSGYHSDGVLHVNSRRAAHMRRKGTPWTPSEHRSFLMGLKKLGKGDWKGISKNYVSTRTPTQVASHAQKYFIRMTTAEKKNRRASLFDIPFKESNLPPHAPTAAPFNASEGSPQVTDAAVAPLKRTTETRGLDWPSAHTVASEKKPPLSPMTRNFVPDTGRLPFMAGVPGQSFPGAPVMPQTELYPMMNHTNYQYPNYYYVPSSHGNFPAPFMNQKPNGMFLQPFPSLYVTSQARPTAGSFATAAPLPNYYQTATGPPTSFAACAPIPNQYPTANGPATSFAACAPFPNQYPTTNGPATGTVDKKDGLEARIGTMSL